MIVYALTGQGDDVYLRMTLLSARSVRLSNPSLRIVVCVDRLSYECGWTTLEEALSGLAEVRIVDTPDGAPSFRNRHMRTRLRTLLSGRFVYLDGDTLVRRPLDVRPDMNCDISAVANHNHPHGTAIDEDVQHFVACDWPVPRRYYNAGVQFWDDTPRSREMALIYHESWLRAVAVTGAFKDQPAFNHAIQASRARVEELPPSYNAQVNSRMGAAYEATIWHFFYSDQGRAITPRTVFEDAVRTPITDIALRRLLSAPDPWSRRDWVSRWIVRRAAGDDAALPHYGFRRAWLGGEHRIALRICADLAARGISRRLPSALKGPLKRILRPRA